MLNIRHMLQFCINEYYKNEVKATNGEITVNEFCNIVTKLKINFYILKHMVQVKFRKVEE